MMNDWGPQRFCPQCDNQLDERWDSSTDTLWWYCNPCGETYPHKETVSHMIQHKQSTPTPELFWNHPFYQHNYQLWEEKEDVDTTHDRTWMSADELYTYRKFVWLFKTYIKARCKLNTFTKRGIFKIWIKFIRSDSRMIMSTDEYEYWMEMFKWKTDVWTDVPMSIEELATPTFLEVSNERS